MSLRRVTESLCPPFQLRDEAAVRMNALQGANAAAPGMLIGSFIAQGPWKLQIHRGCGAKWIPAKVHRSAASPDWIVFYLLFFEMTWSQVV